MPGFLVCNKRSNVKLHDLYPKNYIDRTLDDVDSHTILSSTLNKFLGDKALSSTQDAVCILEGYLLNKIQLFEKYGVSSADELMRVMYQKCGESFFSEFRGEFSGAYYDIGKKQWIVFTNHFGDAPVFYLCENGTFAFASQVNYLTDLCKEQGIKLTFNNTCAYQMLTYGFVATDETYANEIRRLGGGCYLVYSGNAPEIRQYHRFAPNTERFRGKTEDELVEAIDAGFRQAVDLEWKKDEEYGLSHLADMSGGLDSRMSVWVAHAIKDRHASLLTYCKGNYLDETIAKEIACYWNDEIIVKQLDDASFLYDIDELTFLMGGLSLYLGITGGMRLLRSLDLSGYGIEHTGMVGDVVIGSFHQSLEDSKNKLPNGMYSAKLKDRLPESVLNYMNNFADHEMFLMYARGFHGAANSHLIRRNFTEVGSAFMNVEFMQLCFDIPLEMRIGHRLYKKWIIKKYPDAARFKWEKIGGRITESNARVFIRKGFKKLRRDISKKVFRRSVNTGMNPLDHWIETNKKLRAYLDSYESNGYGYLPEGASQQLIADMKQLYKTGTASEKSMVLTVLSASKLYFGEN